jgi:hypothetical protein
MSNDVGVLFLGCFHMANPGLDLANAEIDDVLVPRRQAEIDAVVDGLVQFEPTRVAVELLADRARAVHDSYRAYRDEGAPLRSGEAEQIGFRLAAKLGLDTVDAIDVMDDFWVPAVESVVEADVEAAAHFAALQQEAEADARATEEQLATGSIGEALRAANTPQARRRDLRPYLDHVIRIAAGDDHPGAEMAANWYRRNFKIAANLCDVAQPGDRVIVIYGASHIPVLEHVFDLMSGYALVDTLSFLPKTP